MADDKQKRCFMITPLGEPESEIRKKADGVIDAVIKPVVESFGYALICPHKMNESGSITQQVIKAILKDDLVIVNLTGLNANVMYELAIRHAVNKPVITIVENSTKLPFDIYSERTIKYEDNMSSVDKLKSELTAAIKKISESDNDDNPIQRAKDTLDIVGVLPPNKKGNALEFIINKLGNFEDQLGSIERNLIATINKKYDEAIYESYNIIIENCLDNCSVDQSIEIKPYYSVQDVLDKIYFTIKAYVSAYKYMQSWVLREYGTNLYMIMHEVTSLVPARYIFKKDSRWQIVEWGKYKIAQSKHFSGYGNSRHYM